MGFLGYLITHRGHLAAFFETPFESQYAVCVIGGDQLGFIRGISDFGRMLFGAGYDLARDITKLPVFLTGQIKLYVTVKHLGIVIQPALGPSRYLHRKTHEPILQQYSLLLFSKDLTVFKGKETCCQQIMHQRSPAQILVDDSDLGQALIALRPLLKLGNIALKFLLLVSRHKVSVVSGNVFQLVGQGMGKDCFPTPAAGVFRDRDHRHRILLIHPVCPDKMPGLVQHHLQLGILGQMGNG